MQHLFVVTCLLWFDCIVCGHIVRGSLWQILIDSSVSAPWYKADSLHVSLCVYVETWERDVVYRLRILSYVIVWGVTAPKTCQIPFRRNHQFVWAGVLLTLDVLNIHFLHIIRHHKLHHGWILIYSVVFNPGKYSIFVK